MKISEIINRIKADIRYNESDQHQGDILDCCLADSVAYRGRSSLDNIIAVVRRDNEDLANTVESLKDEILEWIVQYPDDYISDYRNYYVGEHCFLSFDFGEIEIQVEGSEDLSAARIDFIERETDTVYSSGYFYYNLTGSGFFIKLDQAALEKIIIEIRENS